MHIFSSSRSFPKVGIGTSASYSHFPRFYSAVPLSDIMCISFPLNNLCAAENYYEWNTEFWRLIQLSYLPCEGCICSTKKENERSKKSINHTNAMLKWIFFVRLYSISFKIYDEYFSYTDSILSLCSFKYSSY